MADPRFALLNLPLAHARNLSDDASIEAPMFLFSALSVAAFAVWALALLAIAHSQRHGLTAKTLWGLMVLALPIFGGAFWFLFVRYIRPPADPPN